MSIWMYHTLTRSVYPVPANTIEEAAILADKLEKRIFFEAELTTQPLERDERWWVKDDTKEGFNSYWHAFLIEEEARDFAKTKGLKLFSYQFREPEVFLVPVELEKADG